MILAGVLMAIGAVAMLWVNPPAEADESPIVPLGHHRAITVYDQVVVGSDGTPTSLYAVDRAAEVAEAAHAKLVVVTAYTEGDPSTAPRPVEGAHLRPPRCRAGPQGPGEVGLRSHPGAGADSSTSASSAGVQPRPSSETAGSDPASLIVVGNRGLGASEGQLPGIGSTRDGEERRLRRTHRADLRAGRRPCARRDATSYRRRGESRHRSRPTRLTNSVALREKASATTRPAQVRPTVAAHEVTQCAEHRVEKDGHADGVWGCNGRAQPPRTSDTFAYRTATHCRGSWLGSRVAFPRCCPQWPRPDATTGCGCRGSSGCCELLARRVASLSHAHNLQRRPGHHELLARQVSQPMTGLTTRRDAGEQRTTRSWPFALAPHALSDPRRDNRRHVLKMSTLIDRQLRLFTSTRAQRFRHLQHC